MFKKMTSALFVAAMAAPVMMSAHADDAIERQILQDAQYPQVKQKATELVNKRGYQVVDVDADDEFGKPILKVEGVKNNQEYDIKLSYPDLKIISEELDK